MFNCSQCISMCIKLYVKLHQPSLNIIKSLVSSYIFECVQSVLTYSIQTMINISQTQHLQTYQPQAMYHVIVCVTSLGIKSTSIGASHIIPFKLPCQWCIPYYDMICHNIIEHTIIYHSNTIIAHTIMIHMRLSTHDMTMPHTWHKGVATVMFAVMLSTPHMAHR